MGAQNSATPNRGGCQGFPTTTFLAVLPTVDMPSSGTCIGTGWGGGPTALGKDPHYLGPPYPVAQLAHCPAGGSCPEFPTHAKIWGGGGGPKAIGHRRDEYARTQAELVAVTLKPWGSRYGQEAACQTKKSVEENIDGSVAASTRRNYEGHFKKR